MAERQCASGNHIPLARAYTHKIHHIFFYMYTRKWSQWLSSSDGDMIIIHTYIYTHTQSSALKWYTQMRTWFWPWQNVGVFLGNHFCTCMRTKIHANHRHLSHRHIRNEKTHSEVQILLMCIAFGKNQQIKAEVCASSVTHHNTSNDIRNGRW